MSKPPGAVRLYPVPMNFRQGNAWVTAFHRHNKEVRGCKFVIGAADGEGTIWGVAIAGRPIAREEDDGFTIEVTRTVVGPDAPPNVNSFLEAACWRAAREQGYRRVVTRTQEDESGVSLVAAGYRLIAERPARASWADSTRNRRLRAMRDAEGNGGVPRKVWEVLAEHAATFAYPKPPPVLEGQGSLFDDEAV